MIPLHPREKPAGLLTHGPSLRQSASFPIPLAAENVTGSSGPRDRSFLTRADAAARAEHGAITQVSYPFVLESR